MKVLPILVASLLAVAGSSAYAQGGRGKGGPGHNSPPPTRSGGGDGGGQSTPPPSRGGGGQSTPPPSRGGGGQSTPPPSRGGGGQSSPPVRNNGGGGQSSPPVRNNGGGGQSTPPPTRRGGGDPTTPPPVRNNGGGGQSSPPVRNDGGGQTSPPVRNNGGGGQSTPPPTRRGGGDPTSPPVRNNGGGGQTSPPVRNNDQGGPSRGGGGQSLPPEYQNRGGSRGDSGPITRGDNGQVGPPIQRGGGLSRSGQVKYSSDYNKNQGNSRNNGYQMPPPPVISNSAISREANREGGQIHRTYGNYRSGYYAYNNRWRDDDFCYPYYAFNYSNGCYPTPFYYYPQCPGYVTYIRLDFGYFSFRWTQGDIYNWRPRSSGYDWYNDRSYHNSALDRSVQDIYDAFDRGRIDYMNDLIPSRGLIGIEVDRAAQYRISADDFYDMLRDMVETTDTITYKIKRVRLYRGGASIEAEHVFRDPFGRTQHVEHYYGLRETGYGYEITNFRSEG